MRKAVLATTIALIVILMEPMEQGVIVRANMIFNISVDIKSPQNYKNKMYTTSSINISVLVSIFGNTGSVRSISYSVDGKPNRTLSISDDINPDNGLYDNLGTGTLTNLTDGYHYLMVYYIYYMTFGSSTSTIFLVNATGFHTPKPLSPLNTTYSKNEVPLTYTSEENKYSVYYKLDNSSDYTSITSNTTLSGLSEGQHTVTVKATDSYGTLYSEQTTYFTVDTIKKEWNFGSANLTILAITLCILTIGSVLAVVIHRKRKISK